MNSFLQLKNQTLFILAIFLLASLKTHAQEALKLQKYWVEYTVKNAGFNSKGRFDNMTADVVFDENALDKSRISATVQVNSFHSGIAMRDKHLKDKNYFDAETYPTITLVSTQITKSGNNAYIGTFNLTIKNITQNIQFPFSVIRNGNQLEFKTAELSIDRTAYGVGGSSFSLSNTVRVAINATFIKETTPNAR